MNRPRAIKPRTGLGLLGVTLVCASAAGLLVTWRSGSAAAQPALAGPTLRTNPAALRFERNQGQFDDSVRYLARGQGYGLHLTGNGATLVLSRPGSDERAQVSLRVVGAVAVEPSGVGELAGTSNYAVGSDRQRWVEGAAAFGAVKYQGLLPGVDLVYYATGARELEYDFLLAPGVAAESIELALDGVSDWSIDANGDASLRLQGGVELRQRRPLAYQLDSAGVRHFLPASFRRLGATGLGFSVSGVDPERGLVVDPVLTYATYLGGSKFDEFSAVATDAAGNTYAVGYTTGNLFPTKVPAQPGFGGGNSDVVIVKLNTQGTDFVYATYLGGADTDRGYGLVVDAIGNAYVTGVTYSNNFPTLGAMQPTFGGGLQDGFVTKLNPAGGFVYSSYLGGSGDDLGQGIALSATGEAVVTGNTSSSNFPRAAAFQSALSGVNDAFVSKLSAAGGTLVYSTYLGGTGSEYGQAITLDSSGGAIVAGQTGSTNFPTLLPAQATFGGSQADAFVTRFTSAGSALVYSTFLGGTSTDVATGVAQFGGSAIVVGYTSSANFPRVGASQINIGGGTDAFLARVRSSGGAFDQSTFLGGSGADQANGVVVDALGFIYVLGQTSSSDFPLQLPLAGQATLSGSSDAFLTGYLNNDRAFSSFLGGNAADVGAAIVLGAGNTLYVLGNTFSTNFPTTPGAVYQAPIGPQDGFVAKLSGLSLTPAPAGSPLTWLCLAGLLLGSGLVAASRSRYGFSQ